MPTVPACVDCPRETVTDLAEFDDMPIEAWWESKGRRCVRCRRRAAEGRKAPVAHRPALGLPKPGTQRRSLYDLLLTVGAEGATCDQLCRTLRLREPAVRTHLRALGRAALVEPMPNEAWRVTIKENN